MSRDVTLSLPADLVEAIAERAAELVLERLRAEQAEPVDRWLDVKAAAAYTRLPVGQLYKLTAARRIPHVRRGRRLLFDRTELDAWLREAAVPARNRMSGPAQLSRSFPSEPSRRLPRKQRTA